MRLLGTLESQLRTALKSREQALLHGSPVDYSEYKYLVGVIAGLTLALETHLVLQKQQQQDDDND